MATIYKVTGKNTGKDVSVTITTFDNVGNQISQVNAAQLGILQDFEVECDYTNWETKSIINGGQCFYESLPHGAKCKLSLMRTSSALEDMETTYRRNSKNGVQLTYKIQYQTRNADGSFNTRALIDCKPHNWKLGSYKPDSDVAQSVDFVSGDLTDNS